MGLTPVSYKDFTPIANLAFDELVLMVDAKSKYKSVKEIIDSAKANPQKITVGGTQLGGSDSICTYLIEKAAGVKFNFIVFNGGGEVNAALLGGHVDIGIRQPRRGPGALQGGQGESPGRLRRKASGRRSRHPHDEGAGVRRHSSRATAASAPRPAFPADARKVLEEALFKYTKTEIFKKYCRGQHAHRSLDGWQRLREGP